MQPHSIYLHIPFCRHRCAYCDFNTYAGQETLIPAYSDALVKEIRHLANGVVMLLPVHTIYFGGGTPSLMPAASFAQILTEIHENFDIHPGAEITIEANPGTLTPNYLRDLHSLGINRLSLGAQSAQTEELSFLERQHEYADVVDAVSWARRAGFDNISLDLIFGLPDQPLENWEWTLTLALGLNPEHLSLYALTLEHGTPMQHWADRGLINIPNPDAAADMYDLACEYLDKAGYQQYEISNWAKAGSEEREAGIEKQVDTHHSTLVSRHNLQYWRNQPYLGFGAGAHGFAGNLRTANVLSPSAYIQRNSEGKPKEFPRTPATVNAQKIDRETEMRETMMMGLRLTREGVSDVRFQERFGASLREVFAGEIEKLEGFGLLEWVGDTLRLTPPGRLVGNQVFVEFV